jgi:hypothetical protein
MLITNEIEHEDGSATYTFDLSEKEREIMTSQGILWSIVSGITGVTPEDVLREYLDKNETDQTL